MSTPPDPLDSLLQRLPAPPPAESVAPAIWRRIAEEKMTAGSPGWLARLETAFSRPSFAALFVIACTLLGLFLAEVRVSHLRKEQHVQLVQSYLRLVDPLFAGGPPPSAPAAVPSS